MADIANSKLFIQNEGIRQLKDALVVLIKTEWNSEITDLLEKSCVELLKQNGIRSKTIIVPGAIEIPFAINQYALTRGDQASFIAFGCIVKGGTPHFDYVCKSVTEGITTLNLQLDTPTIFGILTVDNMEQARERVGGIHGDKGAEAAMTALKMMLFNKQLKERKA